MTALPEIGDEEHCSVSCQSGRSNARGAGGGWGRQPAAGARAADGEHQLSATVRPVRSRRHCDPDRQDRGYAGTLAHPQHLSAGQRRQAGSRRIRRHRNTLPHRGGAEGRRGPEAVHAASLPRGGGALATANGPLLVSFAIHARGRTSTPIHVPCAKPMGATRRRAGRWIPHITRSTHYPSSRRPTDLAVHISRSSCLGRV